MALTGKKTFVGFGFGAIQSGLFLYEAYQSGNFGRLVVAEVMPDVVAAVRQANDQYFVNIAFADQVVNAQVGPIEIFNPTVETDRQKLIDAIAEADEIATAVPSVNFYASDQPSSLHKIIALGLTKKISTKRQKAVVYAAENHNHAAEILEECVVNEMPQELQGKTHDYVCFLNTVIGKMSQVVTDPDEIKKRKLLTITPNFPRAFLVEEFNRILISKINFSEPYFRGIESLSEKNDLLPFEEAKLYGHNATHALAGYIGKLCNVELVVDLERMPGVIDFLRSAFISESGKCLVKKYSRVDPLFTYDGYIDYADDLLKRMFNPFLMDSIDRVTRDTERKLGWNDRLVGTIRVAITQGVKPYRYALGVAAAAISIDCSISDESSIRDFFTSLWKKIEIDEKEKSIVLEYIYESLERIKEWQSVGFPNLEKFIQSSIQNSCN